MRRFVPPNVLAALWRFYRRTEQAELDLIAAGVAFYGFLAIFPAAAAVIAIWGFVSDPDVIRGHYRSAGPLVPDLVHGWDDEEEKRKPSPWPVRQSLASLGVPAERALINNGHVGSRFTGRPCRRIAG